MPCPLPLIVVPDVNIYLTVARLLGPGFTPQDFMMKVREARNPSRPIDVFTLFASLLQPYPDGASIQISSGTHILGTAAWKAQQPTAASTDEDSGLGWKPEDIHRITDIICDLVDTTDGEMIDLNGTFMHPPLDYEDGCVMRCAFDARKDQALFRRFCITYDRQMTAKMKTCHQVTVCSPEEWCRRIRVANATKWLSRFPRVSKQ
jgi:hypothetical protein